MRRLLQTWFLALMLFCAAGSAFAAGLKFPELTGRVVDTAHILSQGTVQALSQALEAHEKQTSEQVVVVTLPSLQGRTIEDYGYQLGRYWGIGQKGKDNGALLIVAPKERKVRIEVGYGLEGTLTDAASSQIVFGIILPQFRDGNMEQGIIEGTNAILSVLGGQPVGTANIHDQSGQQEQQSPLDILFLIFIFFVLFSRFGIFVMPFGLFGGGGGFGRSSGGGGFGGFSGGGGGFGGGGASGGW